jgi:hypothetical protein
MRRILIDHAKSVVENSRRCFWIQPSTSNLLEVNQAIERLFAQDPRKGIVIELLVFGGLTYDELVSQ